MRGGWAHIHFVRWFVPACMLRLGRRQCHTGTVAPQEAWCHVGLHGRVRRGESACQKRVLEEVSELSFYQCGVTLLHEIAFLIKFAEQHVKRRNMEITLPELQLRQAELITTKQLLDSDLDTHRVGNDRIPIDIISCRLWRTHGRPSHDYAVTGGRKGKVDNRMSYHSFHHTVNDPGAVLHDENNTLM